MNFLTYIDVSESEAAYLLEALQSEMPLRDGESMRLQEPVPFVLGSNPTIVIEGNEPLNLVQRRFLTACGLQFTTRCLCI